MTELDEAPGVGGFGKWSMHGVPHKGWTCVDIEDLGAPEAVCEMCERQDIRYVHAMQHPDFPEILHCGCICAGHMEQDVERARRREASMKNAARRRAGWPDRKAWRRSRQGNLVISERGFHVTIFERDGGWYGLIQRPSTGYKRFSKRTYASERGAQLASFDAILFLEESTNSARTTSIRRSPVQD
jgi:hypothetical protein